MACWLSSRIAAIKDSIQSVNQVRSIKQTLHTTGKCCLVT